MKNLKQPHLVIDIETMDDRPTSVVVNFAAVPFTFEIEDAYKPIEEIKNNAFFYKFDVEEQIGIGRTISKDTMDFWESQTPEARSQLVPSENDKSIYQFHDDLLAWCESIGINDKSYIFCRGASFDFPILRSILEDADPSKSYALFPVPFWNQHCIRSYIAGINADVSINKIPLPEHMLDGFVHHNSVHDCIRGVKHVQFATLYYNGLVDVPDTIDEFSYK